MKKVITVITLVALFLSLVIPAAASSYNAVGPTASGTTHTVKKADPSKVIKDGVIGDGEYERLSVNLNPDQSPLSRVYGDATAFLSADDMLATMEYYASWSDGQINVVDATIIQRVLSGFTKLSAEQTRWCDFNFDGSITIDDVTGIQKYISRTF